MSCASSRWKLTFQRLLQRRLVVARNNSGACPAQNVAPSVLPLGRTTRCPLASTGNGFIIGLTARKIPPPRPPRSKNVRPLSVEVVVVVVWLYPFCPGRLFMLLNVSENQPYPMRTTVLSLNEYTAPRIRQQPVGAVCPVGIIDAE